MAGTAKLMKENTLWCVAQCLNLLDRVGTKPKDSCNYNVNTGNAYEYFVSV